MIERARELNENSERVRFHHNDAPDLRLFGDESFDFILSLIVLQHMEPELMQGYLREFVRVLRPGGVAFFNVPERLFVFDDALPPEAWRASLTLIGTIPPLAPGRGRAAEDQSAQRQLRSMARFGAVRVGRSLARSDGSAGGPSTTPEPRSRRRWIPAATARCSWTSLHRSSPASTSSRSTCCKN